VTIIGVKKHMLMEDRKETTIQKTEEICQEFFSVLRVVEL